MKKAQKIVCKTIVLFLLAFVYSCGVDEKKQKCPECDCPVADESYDNGIIFPDKAGELYANYDNRRAKLIKEYEKANEKGKKDYKPEQNQTSENDGNASQREFKVARYVSYDYEDLKKYLAYVENEAKLSGEKLSTMRFYFANYANEETFKDGDSVKHPRQNSIMMSPTVKKYSQEHIFYTEDGVDGKRKIVLLDNDFQKRKGEGTNQEQSGSKSEASFLPAFLSPSSTPLMFAARSTTKNEGHSNP